MILGKDRKGTGRDQCAVYKLNGLVKGREQFPFAEVTAENQLVAGGCRELPSERRKLLFRSRSLWPPVIQTKPFVYS
jgi:hypothetical protein